MKNSHTYMKTSFEWDEKKNSENVEKHGVDFETAQYAFIDPMRIVAEDTSHSKKEKRYYVFGKVKGGVLTVRFTYRANRIRIIGAGYWRKGKKIYEKQNQVQ
ncbi:BrnT family toxin [Candidatus Gottesmanbacteria bacterium]|nr:BrnT family toxin [Candidatus Gottesmanbacteria bacterium]